MDNKIINVKMAIKGKGDIFIELYAEIAPVTVENFLKLVDARFYDGKIFHRVISGFMIQGGCPSGSGTGGPGWNIKGEFSANGIKNPLKHSRGVISMARAQAFDSAGSQFFIMHKDSFFLDGQYAAFGKVTKGMEIIDSIASCNTDKRDRPDEEQIIESVSRHG
jgi:peptidyl-prolyl cis-trans isomerase B (cyclophilin B)